MSPAPRPFLTARHYTWLAIAFFLLALYGSLVPLTFHWIPFEQAKDWYRVAIDRPIHVESRSDWAANILLFIPLAYLTMAALNVDRPRWRSWAWALAVVPACSLLSASIEFLQLYFPPRVTSPDDIVAETIGGAIGTVTWLGWGPQITGWLRVLWQKLDAHGFAARLLPGYLMVLLLLHVMPLNLSISPVEMYHKYKDGLIRLRPYDTVATAPMEALQKNLCTLIYYAPLGWLLAHLGAPVWRDFRSWKRVLALGLGTAAAIEFCQLFCQDRSSEAGDVITGGLAVLAAWWVTLAGQRWDMFHIAAVAGQENQRQHRGRLLVLAAWLALVVFVGWQPFNFTTDPDFLQQRRDEFHWLPFVDYQAGTESHAFDQVLHKILLFFPLGVLLTPIVSGAYMRAAATVVVVALVVAGIVELGQLYLPTHYASTTDMLIEALGAWLGFALVYHMRRGTTRS